MKPPDLTSDEMHAINELNTVMRTIGSLFVNNEGYPALLRAGVDALREAADLLEGLAARWEDDVYRS